MGEPQGGGVFVGVEREVPGARGREVPGLQGWGDGTRFVKRSFPPPFGSPERWEKGRLLTVFKFKVLKFKFVKIAHSV